MLIVSYIFFSRWYIISIYRFTSFSSREMYDNSVFLFLVHCFRGHQLFFFWVTLSVFQINFLLSVHFNKFFAFSLCIHCNYFELLRHSVNLAFSFDFFLFLFLICVLDLQWYMIFLSVFLAVEFHFFCSTLSSYWIFLLSYLIFFF